MGTLNQPLGMNLTDEQPLISNPYNVGMVPYGQSAPIPEDDFLLLQSMSSKFLLLNGQTLKLL